MSETALTRTSTTRYPVFASKAALMAELKRIMDQNGNNHDYLYELLHRLSNTDTSTFADPTGRGDA